MFHYTVETELSVDEALQALEGSFNKRELGVLWQLNIPMKLLEKGINLDQQFRVLEVCNPDVAKKVLNHNQLGGYFLPCRVVVYKSKDSGKTVIGLVKPTELMKLTGDDILQNLVHEVEQLLITAIDEASGKTA